MKKSLAGLMLAVLSHASVAGEQFIVKDGKANAEIVIAGENRPRMATLAALELQYFIQRMSGARLPIVTSPGASAPVKIHVGRSPETERLGVKTDDLKYGAFRIASGDGCLALVGDDRDFVPPFEPWPMSRSAVKESDAVWQKRIASVTDAGWVFPFRAGFKNAWNLDNKGVWNSARLESTMNGRYGEGASALWMSGGNTIAGFWHEDENGSLNAVHEFLRGLGVRVYMPGEENEIIRLMVSIELPKIEKTLYPDYALRNWSWYYYGAFGFEDVLWARRLGMNYGYEQTGLVRGPHGLCFVYVSDECKKNHPEYFALFGGERDFEHRGGGSACFSSEALEKETAKYIRFMFDEFKFPLVDIWPIDGLKPCQCDKCRGLTPSEQVWGFANRVAADVHKTHPDKIVSCGAYTSYIEAPDTIEKFSPNLAVWISNCGRPKMTDPEHWDKYMARIQKWQSKLAPGRILRLENSLYHLYKRDANPLMFPVMHPHGTAKDLKALKGISMGDSGEQSQKTGKWAGMALNHLNLYVQSRCLWDSQQDVDKLLDEYYALFYGPVAKEMKEAFSYAENNLAIKDTSRGAGRGDVANVPLEVAVKFRELLQTAKAAAGDGVYGQRIGLVLSSLIPKEELIAKHEEDKKRIEAARANAPTAVGVEGSDLRKAPEYFLKNAKTGEEPALKTSFKAGWDKNALILEITCKDPDVRNLLTSTDVYNGEYVAITIQTPFHTHYILEINPDGLIMEANPVRGWKSLAEVKPERSEDFWRLTVRIPAVGPDEAVADPNHRVAGQKPTPESPWYINVGRQIQKNKKRDSEIQLFSLSQNSAWHDPVYFGRLEIR